MPPPGCRIIADRQAAQPACLPSISMDGPSLQLQSAAAVPDPACPEDVTTGGTAAEEKQAISLDLLPLDALAAVLRFLAVSDVLQLSRINRAFREMMTDERVWQLLCAREWPRTDVRRWVVQPAGRELPVPLAVSPLTPPASFREVYLLLHEASKLAADGGAWRLLGTGPRSALIQFKFMPDALVGHRLEWHALDEAVEREEWLSICPTRLFVAVQSVDDRMAALAEHARRPAGTGLHRSPSAEAAAAVMLGGSGRSSPLGTSPQLVQFEAELAQFMSPLVQSGSGRKQRRRSATGTPYGGGGGGDGGPVSHHLERVPLPLPTRQHPLVGMWAAAPNADDSVQVISWVAARGALIPISSIFILRLHCKPSAERTFCMFSHAINSIVFPHRCCD